MQDMLKIIDAIDDTESINDLRQLKRTLEYDYIRGDIEALIVESEEGIDRVKKIITTLKDFSHIDEDVFRLEDLHRASEALPPALSRLSGTVDQLGRTVQAAGPVVSEARPVVADLRPIVGNVQGSLGELKPVTARLDSVTARVVPWMNDLSAFVYNTSSVFSLSDANGTLARGHLAVNVLDPTGLGTPRKGGDE